MKPPFIDLRLPDTDAWGTRKTTIDKSVFHGMFTYDVPAKMWFVRENNVEVPNSTATGGVSEGGMLKVISQGNNTAVASRRHPRYQPNRGHLYSSSIILPDPDADGIREWGSYTVENGVFFRLESGTLYAVRRSMSVDYAEEIELAPGADISKGCLYDIQMQWRGVGDVMFFVSTNAGTKIHHMKLLGILDAVSIANPALPTRFECEKKTEDVTLYCGCVDITSEGGELDREQYGSVIAEDIATVGTGSGIIAIRSPAQINGSANTRDIRLARVGAYCDKKATFAMYMFRDPTAITTTGWTAVGGGSYTEKADSITAYDTSKMQLILKYPVAAATFSSITNPADQTIDFFIVHGDYLFIEGFASTGTSTASIEWGEEI